MRIARCVVLFFLIAPMGRQVEALSLTIDPGSAGTSAFYQDFLFVNVLGGAPMSGQTDSVDIIFMDGKYLVAGAFEINLWVNQDSQLGVWPTSYSSVTGYLLDAAGNPLTGTVDFTHTGTMPTQIWPGWGYYLPNGTEYLPAATGYTADFSGNPIDIDPWNNYFLDPIVFHGVHFDITYPNTPAEGALGLRMSLSNYSLYYDNAWHNPIYVSPDPMPQFFVPVPEPSTALLLGTGLIGLISLRKRGFRAHVAAAEAVSVERR